MPTPLPSARALLRRLGCTPAEGLAIAVLALGALAVLGVLWLQSRPAGSAVVAPSVGATASPEGLEVSAGEVVVHVAGAVRSPGVYTLPGGSRVGEAVAAAGGPRRKAVLDGLNLARPVTDGEQVLVPRRGAGGGAEAEAATPDAGAAGGKLNINQATAADLETLPGIGPVLASRIAEHRDSIGGFKEVGELRDVPGIGEKTFQALVDLVTL